MDPDDDNRDVYPGAEEICDRLDNDGDGRVDEGACGETSETGPEGPCSGLYLPLVRVDAGTFTMGSPEGEIGAMDDETLHEVTLSHDTLVGTTEVTLGQFETCMGYRPSSSLICLDCPVVKVMQRGEKRILAPA